MYIYISNLIAHIIGFQKFVEVKIFFNKNFFNFTNSSLSRTRSLFLRGYLHICIYVYICSTPPHMPYAIFSHTYTRTYRSSRYGSPLKVIQICSQGFSHQSTGLVRVHFSVDFLSKNFLTHPPEHLQIVQLCARIIEIVYQGKKIIKNILSDFSLKNEQCDYTGCRDNCCYLT